MKITRNQLRKVIKEAMILENKLKDFIGDNKVYDYDKDRNKNPIEKKIVVMIKIGSSGEYSAEQFAKGYGEDNGYKYDFKKYIDDPINPKEGYYLFSKK